MVSCIDNQLTERQMVALSGTHTLTEPLEDRTPSIEFGQAVRDFRAIGTQFTSRILEGLVACRGLVKPRRGVGCGRKGAWTSQPAPDRRGDW